MSASGYCAVRLWAPDGFPLDQFTDAALDRFRPLGVDGKGMFGLVVLDVPPEADLAVVRYALQVGLDAGHWRCDELCVTDAWRAAAP